MDWLKKILLLLLLLATWHSSSSFVLKTCAVNCTCILNRILCTSKRLEYIDRNFTILSSAEVLDYSGNKLELLKNNSFEIPGIQAIKELYLNDSNVVSINKFAFNKCTNLELLDLSENILDFIPSSLIQANRKLKSLKLASNFFRKTPELISLSLEILDLSDSNIGTFGEKNVMNLPSLKVLYLQQNSLQTLGVNTFLLAHNLLHVDLSYNNWKCNCSTAKIFHELTNKGIINTEEVIRCRNSSKKYTDLITKEGSVYWKKYCSSDDSNNEEMNKILPLIDSQKKPENTTEGNQNYTLTKQHSTTQRNVFLVMLTILLISLTLSALTYYYYVHHIKKHYDKLQLITTFNLT